jgi:predicted lipase
MSFLVEIAESAYPKDAMKAFTTNSAFGLENARAMMWMSQLAYETAHQNEREKKIENILNSFQLTMLDCKSNQPETGLPPKSCCLVIACGRGATFVTFAGSDPLKFEDWITNFNVRQSADGTHQGFEAAINTVWSKIEPAIKKGLAIGPALFFTGHSLGGALAIVAALRAANEFKIQPTVYTFGSPRTGGALFFNSYQPLLGNSTYRLIDGDDVVPTVPAAQPGGYLHVGKSIQCRTDGLFDDPPTITGAAEQNLPDFVANAIESGIDDFRAFSAFQFIRRIGPRLLDRAASVLPRVVRDHVPANYFRALGIPLS